MNYNLIFQFTLLFSVAGLGKIIFSKMPDLVELPENLELEEKENPFVRIRKWIDSKNPLRNFDYVDFLSKILKKIRVLFLKTDNKIFGWSQRLKENSQKKKIREEEDYWDKIQKKD